MQGYTGVYKGVYKGIQGYTGAYKGIQGYARVYKGVYRGYTKASTIYSDIPRTLKVVLHEVVTRPGLAVRLDPVLLL